MGTNLASCPISVVSKMYEGLYGTVAPVGRAVPGIRPVGLELAKLADAMKSR